VSPTDTPPPAPTVTPTLGTTTNCAWNWATQPLPEVSAQLQAALDAAGIPGATGSAVAFGENCIDYQTNQVRGFAVMETDFGIQVPVASLTDLEALGNLAGQVLLVLERFPVGQVPGPQPGQVQLIFSAGGEELALTFTVEQAAAARSAGLSGAVLLEALRAAQP